MINENDDIRKAVLKEFGTPKVGNAKHPALEEQPVVEKKEEKLSTAPKLKSFGEMIQESLKKVDESKNEDTEFRDNKRKEVIAESRVSLTKELLAKLMR